MRKFAVITTFNSSGYHQYGVHMINSFMTNWPKSYDLYVYYEGVNPESRHKADNIHFLDLVQECPDLIKFKNRYGPDPVANGKPVGINMGVVRPTNVGGKYQGKECFLWDAIRFSHKSFCIVQAGLTIDADVMFWLDADVKAFRPIPDDFFETLITPKAYCAYLDRGKKYSETGFIAYNLKHQYHREFMERIERYYVSGRIFKLRQWHDCEVFDSVRKEMTHEKKITTQNLTPPLYKHNHPFVNSPLGKYLDHLKGNRKDKGTSHSWDIKMNITEDYWKKVRS